MRVWESASDPARNFISARAEGGSWADLGTVPVTLDGLSASGSYRYGDLVLTVAHDAPLTPAEARELAELRERNAELAAQVERLRAENAQLRERPTPTPTPTPSPTATPAPTATPTPSPTVAPAPSPVPGGGGSPSGGLPTPSGDGGAPSGGTGGTPSPTPVPSETPTPTDTASPSGFAEAQAACLARGTWGPERCWYHTSLALLSGRWSAVWITEADGLDCSVSPCPAAGGVWSCERVVTSVESVPPGSPCTTRAGHYGQIVYSRDDWSCTACAHPRAHRSTVLARCGY